MEVVPERLLPTGDPGPEQPQKAQPFDNPRRPRQPPVEDDVALQPGDVSCARCQAANAPSRHFCRRCGQPLQSGEAAQDGAGPATGPLRRRWWQRLLWWQRTPQDVPGTVALPPSWKQRVWSALPVAVLAGLVVLALGPFRPAIVERLEDARRRISPRYEQVYPAAVQATSAVDGHPPEAAVDRAPNTYWSEAGPTPGEGEALTFRFDRPVDLARIGFFNGAQAKPQDFLSQPRLREAHLSFDTAPAVSLVLKDRDAFQNHGIEAKAVTTVRLSIVSVYLSPQGGTDASLGEVEFFISA